MKQEKVQPKLSKRKERQIENRIFGAQSRMFAGELPDRIFKNGKELDFLTVKSNELPRIECLQEGVLFDGLEGFIWKVNKPSDPKKRLEIRPNYKFKKKGKHKIILKYRRNHMELHFNAKSKRDLYFDELINGRKIHEIIRAHNNQHTVGQGVTDKFLNVD